MDGGAAVFYPAGHVIGIYFGSSSDPPPTGDKFVARGAEFSYFVGFFLSLPMLRDFFDAYLRIFYGIEPYHWQLAYILLLCLITGFLAARSVNRSENSEIISELRKGLDDLINASREPFEEIFE